MIKKRKLHICWCCERFICKYWLQFHSDSNDDHFDCSLDLNCAWWSMCIRNLTVHCSLCSATDMYSDIRSSAEMTVISESSRTAERTSFEMTVMSENSQTVRCMSSEMIVMSESSRAAEHMSFEMTVMSESFQATEDTNSDWFLFDSFLSCFSYWNICVIRDMTYQFHDLAIALLL